MNCATATSASTAFGSTPEAAGRGTGERRRRTSGSTPRTTLPGDDAPPSRPSVLVVGGGYGGRPLPIPLDGRLVVSGCERAVVVAVIVVPMVQVTRDDVIDVIAVPNGLVTALRIVAVLGFVPGAIVVWRAAGGVGV